MEDEDETSTTSEAEMDEEDDEFVSIFTKQEETVLLERMKEIKQSICICKSCMINKMTDIVYEITKKRKLRPKSVQKTLTWDENWQLDSEWQNKFEQRHKDQISKFPLNCTISTQVPTRKFLYIPPEILTFDEEQFYLVYLKEIQILHNCMCRKCIISMVPLQTYLLARDLKKQYPKSWDIDKYAGFEWIRKFILQNINEFILKLSPKCTWPISIHQEFNVILNVKQEDSWIVFLASEERLLLTKLQEIGEHCKCKNCLMKEVSFSIYIMAQDLERNYPKVWDRVKQPSVQWMAQFEERHKYEISKLLPACATFSLWTRLKTGAIFTYEKERLLLTQVQEMETQCCCKCKKCLMKEISIVAYKEACKLKKWYPKWWDIEERAGELWMQGFQERHEDQISKFPSVCNIKIPQALRKREIYVGRFTYDEGQMLITLLQEMETVHGCKCKNCLKKELLNLAYVMAYELNIAYPKSWDKNKQAGYNWLQRFEEKHRDEISEFSTTCKIFETSTTKQMIRGVLTDENEKILLIMIKDMEFHYGCNCKMCFMKVLSILVYKIAHELKKCYPIWWDIRKEAGIWWKQQFAKRHEDEISKLSSVCKRHIFTRY